MWLFLNNCPTSFSIRDRKLPLAPCEPPQQPVQQTKDLRPVLLSPEGTPPSAASSLTPPSCSRIHGRCCASPSTKSLFPSLSSPNLRVSGTTPNWATLRARHSGC